jgi:hypothetical protein
VEGVSDEYKYALVSGAVAGGGLTVIANAPNPAGFAILKDNFHEQSINAFGLFAAALRRRLSPSPASGVSVDLLPSSST